jgi:hypothetical protein
MNVVYHAALNMTIERTVDSFSLEPDSGMTCLSRGSRKKERCAWGQELVRPSPNRTIQHYDDCGSQRKLAFPWTRYWVESLGAHQPVGSSANQSICFTYRNQSSSSHSRIIGDITYNEKQREGGRRRINRIRKRDSRGDEEFKEGTQYINFGADIGHLLSDIGCL